MSRSRACVESNRISTPVSANARLSTGLGIDALRKTLTRRKLPTNSLVLLSLLLDITYLLRQCLEGILEV